MESGRKICVVMFCGFRVLHIINLPVCTCLTLILCLFSYYSKKHSKLFGFYIDSVPIVFA